MPVTSCAKAFLGTLSQERSNWLDGTTLLIVSFSILYEPPAASKSQVFWAAPAVETASFALIVSTTYIIGETSSLNNISTETTSEGVFSVIALLNKTSLVVLTIPIL